jgi:hypothetical protein
MAQRLVIGRRPVLSAALFERCVVRRQAGHWHRTGAASQISKRNRSCGLDGLSARVQRRSVREASRGYGTCSRNGLRCTPVPFARTDAITVPRWPPPSLTLARPARMHGPTERGLCARACRAGLAITDRNSDRDAVLKNCPPRSTNSVDGPRPLSPTVAWPFAGCLAPPLHGTASPGPHPRPRPAFPPLALARAARGPCPIPLRTMWLSWRSAVGSRLRRIVAMTPRSRRHASRPRQSGCRPRRKRA